ncbi:MAG: DNA mismatch repair endonuclease MutL, partial [Chloroflexota bacterium]|nr:DNA mismatch repair endonuclease MutL [Chloroflexota bacterium]
MTVHLLTPDTIGKIAAGEVVERPASVVKELVENAIDANARRIAVTIRGGGLELIEVADDGDGITPDELPIALQRHATSKLRAFEDLDHLATLGFRGEALPSIAAVAAFRLRSRQAAAAHGVELQVEFGQAAPVASVAAPIGTITTVRDLFANVPARLKFLRQRSTEATAITRTLSAYAAAYPEIGFQLIADERRLFTTDGRGDLIAAATGVYGPEVGIAALPIAPLAADAAVPGIDVSGWIGEPRLSRSHRQGLVFFVNGRWVQNRPLAFALEEAYHSLLMVGRHPLALVRIRLDPALVDVNVHPTKAEVKFFDERAVCRAVQRAAHAALVQAPHDVMPQIRFEPSTASPFTEQRAMPLEPQPFAHSGNGQVPPEPEPDPSDPPSGVPILRVLGQVGASFIIAEGPAGVYLIDQHAAHERVMYERILAQLNGQAVEQQALLDPLVVDLAADEQAAFERSASELAQIGFDLEPLSDGAVMVRAIPAVMRGVDIAERLRLILHELADGGEGDSWLDAVAISTACHTSIRAGQSLSLPEMRELVADLERSSQPRACGHGRPTMLHMTQSELERQ